MLFHYKVINERGEQKSGEIETLNKDLAISSLQKRGFVVVSVKEAGKGKGLQVNLAIFEHVPMKDIVIVSRQLSTLFEAQVSAVKAYTLLAETTKNQMLKRALEAVSQDIQGGFSLADAKAKHKKVFSEFYVSMIRAGEESGRLTETFMFLADYLERQYALVSKTRSALVYPSFVITAFIGVMVLMLTTIIPKLTQVIVESGQEIPVYTRVVMSFSSFLVNYGVYMVIALAVGVGFLIRELKTARGRKRLDRVKLAIPVFKNLFSKFYLSRITDNLTTMLSAGIPVIRALEITRDVVGNVVYEEIISDTIEAVKGGSLISSAFGKHPEMPNIMVQMIKVGEETGSLSSILKTLSRFYKREVDTAVDTVIGLIEPAMIILLGVGVGFLLTSVLLPIYNIAGGTV